MTELQFNRFESIKSVLDRAKISYIDEEVEAYMNECEADLSNQTNLEAKFDICNNAIIQGTVAKYLPEYSNKYSEQIKIIRFHAYDGEDTSNSIVRSIKDVLRTLDIPKIDNVEIQSRIKEVGKDIYNKTNVNSSDNEYFKLAVIDGVLSKFIPSKQADYDSQVKLVKFHAYDGEDYSDYSCDRTIMILKGIQIELKKLDIPKVSDNELIIMMNNIQNDIMLKTECCERMFAIDLIANLDTYETEIDTIAFQIRDIVNVKSKSTLEFIPITEWSNTIVCENFGEPRYLTIFDKTISIAPTPTTNSKIAIIAYQKTTAENISLKEEVNPEIPIYADNAIIQGVIAKYDPNRLPLYIEQLEQIKKNSNKYVGNKINNSQIEAKWI